MKANKFFSKYSVLFILLIHFLIPDLLIAGWSHGVHKNYLEEAIRILPYFDYMMCKYYKVHIIEGAIEGEYHFRYIKKGVYPKWINNVKEEEFKFVNGLSIRKENISEAAEFYFKKFEDIKMRIKNVENRNSEMLFEMGYYLHSITNILKPHSHGTNMPSAELLARNTKNIELRTNQIEKIINLKSWLKKIISEKLDHKSLWTQSAESGDRDSFNRLAMKANEMNIYHLASIINYVFDDCFGPEDPKIRKSIQDRINKQYKGGRKPGI